MTQSTIPGFKSLPALAEDTADAERPDLLDALAGAIWAEGFAYVNLVQAVVLTKDHPRNRVGLVASLDAQSETFRASVLARLT